MRSDNYRISVITHVEERPVRSGQQGTSARLEGLMSRVCQAGRADCRLASKVYRGQKRAKQDWGPRQQASTNTNTRGVKTDGICKEWEAAGLEPVSQWQQPQGSSAEPDTGKPSASCVAATPPPLPSFLCLSQRAGGWVGLDQSRSFEWCPEGLEKLVSHLTLTSTARESLEAGELPFSTELRQPRGRRMQET